VSPILFSLVASYIASLLSHLIFVLCCLQAADKYKDWRQVHVAGALMILVGGCQYLLAAPDFGKILSKDKFERILRYWARPRTSWAVGVEWCTLQVLHHNTWHG
jgi:hypothetical protein